MEKNNQMQDNKDEAEKICGISLTTIVSVFIIFVIMVMLSIHY